MGETVCFEIWNQLNQFAFYLLYARNGRNKAFQSSESNESFDYKMIHCFKALETSQTGSTCWSKLCKCNENSVQTCIRTHFTNQLQMFFMCNL